MKFIEVALGVFFTVLLGMILGLIAGSFASFFGLFIVNLIISYFFIVDIKEGAVYGLFVGLFAGITSTLIMFTFEFILGGNMEPSFMSFGISGIIIGIMVDGLICMIGGALGSITNT